MPRVFAALSIVCLGSVIVCVAGCWTPAGPPKPAAAKSSKKAAAKPDEAAEIAAAMAELSDEDRKLAEAQKTCPVGDAPLGSMGMPYAVEVKGRKVFLCCEGCKNSILRDPDKYLAKIDEQAQEK